MPVLQVENAGLGFLQHNKLRDATFFAEDPCFKVFSAKDRIDVLQSSAAKADTDRDPEQLVGVGVSG
jgi:hypothetical protein